MRFIWDTNMTGDLGLKGNELLIYSVVASFSQGKLGCFYGSLEDLGKIVGIDRRSAMRVLQKLVEKALIDKRDIYNSGVKMCAYSVTGGVDKMSPRCRQNVTGGVDKMSPNNKNNNDVDKSTSKKNSDYTDANFKADVISLGVPEDDAAAWMKVRKKKGGVSSERAFELTKEEIEKSGYSAEQCVKVAILRSWCGIKADWVQNHMAKAMSPQQAAAEAEKARQERIRELQEKTVRRSTC